MQILEHILKKKKAKQKFWQSVGNQLATIAKLANCWQPVGNHCEFGNQLANSSQSQLALRNSLTTLHCSFAKFASHKKFQKLREISHCQLRNGVANFATALPISQMHCEIRNLANRLLRISQSYQNSHSFALRFCFAHNFSIRTPF